MKPNALAQMEATSFLSAFLQMKRYSGQLEIAPESSILKFKQDLVKLLTKS